MAGFTLIEVMVALLIVSVALLAIGSFTVSIMGSGQISRERLAAVHLAEQVMEVWQHSALDFVPAIDNACVANEGSAVLTSTQTKVCTPASGVMLPFSIQMSQTMATAPLPSNLTAFQTLTQQGYSTTPQVKLVLVSWTAKGKSHQVYLTHLSKVK